MYAVGVHWKPDPLLYPPYLRARIRRRRGVGCGPHYVPWLKVRDVPSRGTSLVSRGVSSGRSHHLLSELEAIYFYLLERRAGIAEIREQWPILDMDRTLELCARFGVRPRMRNGCPEPFTIDFLVTERVDGRLTYRAASVKSPDDARDPETRLRLAVEHAWCQDRGIPWTLVDTQRFDKTMLETLRFIRGWFRHKYAPDAALEERFVAQFAAHHAPNRLLSEVLARVSRSLRQPVATTEDVFRYCAWSGQIQPSLARPLSMDAPVVMTSDLAHA
nr:TnsA endonuclease N-terminal domain-containing protein [Hydrogenophaga intermedia]